MEDFYLKDIRHDHYPSEEVCEWTFEKVPNRNVRIYYKPDEEPGSGFSFYAVEKTGHVCTPETEKDEWHKEYCIVECVVRGTARFDGIRHLHYGDEDTNNYGYHYYATLEMIVETLLALRQLEKKYCSDYD